MLIKQLFDPAKNIYRTIEKVITYGAAQEARLRAEISEYVVTDSIDEQCQRLLSKMQLAMETGGANEIGVWVSGFYGSGKSSFTKYLGLALDQSIKLDGSPFLKHLQDRLKQPQTRALLAKVATQYPAGVVLLDLASEMLAGATMVDVSTVLYYKVLQWAGYSRNLKVAALERRLKKDKRFPEFTKKIQEQLGVSWSEAQNDPLVTDSVVPEIAHAMYPVLFKSPTAFSTETADIKRFENERVKEMIDIAREHTGKQYLIFIIDEVGQYVGSRQNLILNLDGLAKNLKAIGEGKVWVVGTAQQTLTEDAPQAALNSPHLYKLKDRFPIQIDLESSDIKEICHERLLGKSPEGDKILGERFDKHGQALRYNTKLENARYYDSDFDRSTFIKLYPFLPAHFDILLHLLGQLAKSTGGIGLRSAIKVIQDILVEGTKGDGPVADRPVGWLATTVTIYDSLERDIRRTHPSIDKGVGKVAIRFPGSPLHQEIGKTVAVLQILGNMPVTVQNVSSLMHSGDDNPSRRDHVEAAVKELIADAFVPFGEKDGNLCFLSEKLKDIDQERGQIALRSAEIRRIFNGALRDVFKPPPATKLHNSLVVTTGLKSMVGSVVSALAGERETVQTVVELVEPADYEQARIRLVDESRQKSSSSTIYLLGRNTPEISTQIGEIYRSEEIARRHNHDPDQEVKEYCTAQGDRAAKLAGDVQKALKQSLKQGSFIFRVDTTAVENLDADVLEAGKSYLLGVAEQVFDRYGEAPVRADTALAEKFLRVGDLRAITSALDPLGLVQVSGGVPQIKSDHKALVSIRDYIDRNGTVEGKRLIEHFTSAPFGWSQDTLRYLLAALLVGGEIKLKVAGREVTVNGQLAIDALRTNNGFKPVGVALRIQRPSTAILARAADRLSDLIGETVIPLENEIGKATTRHFPQFQHRFGPLAEKLDALELPGGDSVRSLCQEIADVLLTDASDAPQRLGAEESSLYDGLKSAAQVEVALKQGLEPTVRQLRTYQREIEALPGSGIPGDLRQDVAEDLDLVGKRLAQDDFYKHAADLNTTLTRVEAHTWKAADRLAEAQSTRIKDAQRALQQLPEWGELTQEEQSQQFGQLEALAIAPEHDLAGLKKLLAQEYVLASRVTDLQKQIEQLGRQRRLHRLDQEKKEAAKAGTKVSRALKIPAAVTSAGQLDELIRRLQTLKEELALYGDIEVSIEIEA
jgi:hypothetical protein